MVNLTTSWGAQKYFQLIKEMVPKTEYVPAVLLTNDDYEDDDE